ncbi:hypothetical protein MGMO_105c00630 [Methyloglobulus morosus KoM1]|uniref:Uncharacterized protein n=1 Tax=Methyloglobulus morosus KoM1 TaxID=1116472 RepID=V5BYS1_9GAMM|nr:hypothetical protein MGMO_105c00630 [Methyloglobulus morosus KoM1]
MIFKAMLSEYTLFIVVDLFLTLFSSQFVYCGHSKNPSIAFLTVCFLI